MITPADDFDDGPDRDPDDPLTVILRPTTGHLGPPPGRFEEIRRGAVRRRALRTMAAVGATCAVAALAVLLPLRPTAHDAPVRPVVPLAPPPASSGPTAVPTPSASSPRPAERPTEGTDRTSAPDARASTVPDGTAAPRPERSIGRTPEQTGRDATAAASDGRLAPSVAPSAASTSR